MEITEQAIMALTDALLQRQAQVGILTPQEITAIIARHCEAASPPEKWMTRAAKRIDKEVLRFDKRHIEADPIKWLVNVMTECFEAASPAAPTEDDPVQLKNVAQRIADAYNKGMAEKARAGAVKCYEPATPEDVVTESSSWTLPYIIDELLRLDKLAIPAAPQPEKE